MDTAVDRKPGKKRKIIILIIIIVTAVLLIAGFTGYFLGEHYYGSHFMKGTIVNGIDVSKMSVEELEDKIQDYTLTIEERTSEGDSEEETITGSQIGLTLVSDGELQKLLEKQQGGRWIFGKGQEYRIEELTEYDEKLWQEVVDNLQCFSDDFVSEWKNAYVTEYDETRGGFQIVDEVLGNQTDRDKVIECLSGAVIKLEDKVNLEEEECYREPEVTADSKELNEFCDKLNQYADMNITYTFGESVEELTGADICGWLNIDYDNYTVSLDTEKVSTYVSYLKWNYDTIFGTRKFMTSYGQEVTIEGGDYGWWMNKEQETAELAAMIEAGESGDRTPVYYQEAAAYGDVDYGNTYVEINLTAQHLFLYVNGEKIMESDFTSGIPSNGHLTPPGTYAVTYTQRYATLRGDNYETMVSYWMPFNEDIGLHDATWKTEFGSQFYRSAGSHGCVNLPYNFAKEIYNYVEKGMPIICYNLAGTESTSVTIQSDEEKAQSVIDAINEIATSSKPAKQTENARILYSQLAGAVKAKVTNYSDLLAYEAQY